MGPEALISILVGTVIEEKTDPSTSVSRAVTLAFMVGILNFGLGLLRFGFLQNIFSRPILTSFINAVAFLITIEQLDVFCGIEPNVLLLPIIFSFSLFFLSSLF